MCAMLAQRREPPPALLLPELETLPPMAPEESVWPDQTTRPRASAVDMARRSLRVAMGWLSESLSEVIIDRRPDTGS